MSILRLQAKDAITRIGAYDALNAVQNFNWDGAMNEENLTQLGDANYDAQTVQPEISGTFEVRTTGAASSILSKMIYQLDPGTGEYLGYTSTNGSLIRETDLERAVFEFIESKKANELFDRSTLFPRATLKSLSYSARVDGNASESYAFDSEVLEVFRKPKHDVKSLAVTRTALAPTTTVDVPVSYAVEAGTVIPGAGWTIYALDIDGRRVYAADLVVTSGAPDTVALGAGPIAAGITIPIGARTALIVYKKVPGAFPTLSYPTTARFVKADQINIYVVDPTDTFTVGPDTGTVEALLALGVDLNDIPFLEADVFERVQSSEVSIDLQREALKEIRKNDRGNPVYYRAATYPIPISVSMTALETDLNDWAKLQNKNVAGSVNPDILDLADFENREWMLIQRYYKVGVTLQTLGILNIRVNNPGGSVAVGGSAERTWSFTGSKFALQGVVGV